MYNRYLLLLCCFWGSLLLSAQHAWSDPATWPGGQLPRAGQDVIIPAGRHVRLDVSPPALGGLRIEGTLEVTAPRVDLTAEWILVSGLFQIGTEAHPYTGRATIEINGADVDIDGMGGRFLGTMAGGSLEFHGASRAKLPWTKITKNAFVGATEVQLLERPASWAVGDSIVVAPSGFDAFEAEAVRITAIDDRTVRFTPALRFNHWGELQTYEGRTVDERTEVAHLTRNITVRSPAAAVAENFGAHTMIMPGSGPVHLEGVQFLGMGQPGRAARYSFHWHLAGDRDGDYVRRCSFRRALQRGVVVHGTNNVLVEDNVTYRVRNHAYIAAEDGNEIHNTFRGNIAVLTLQTREGEMAFPDGNHPETKSSQSEHRSSAFWLRNVHNYLTDNVAAGVERGVGFFYDRFGRHRDFRHHDVLPEDIVFSGNVAHSCAVRARSGNAGSNVAMYTQVGHGFGLFIDNFDLTNDDPPYVFGDFVAYKNSMSGIWNEETNVIFRDMVLADNTSAFLTGEGYVEHMLVVGQTADTIGGLNRQLRHGNRRAGFYTVSQGGKKRPRFTDVTFVNMHDGTQLPEEAAAFIMDYHLDMRTNFVEQLRLVNTRPAWMEVTGAITRKPNGAMLFDKDGSLTGYDEPVWLTFAISPLRRDDCDPVPEWDGIVCPAEDYINLTIPRVDRLRFNVYLDQSNGVRCHDGGLNTRYNRMHVGEEATVFYDHIDEPLRAFGIGFSPAGANRGGDFVQLRIPYPWSNMALKDHNDQPIPRAATLDGARNAPFTAYYYDAAADQIYLKAYATGQGDEAGLDWVHIGEGNQQPTTISTTSVATVFAAGATRVYPNPATTTTTVNFSLVEPREVTVSLMDVLGRVLRPGRSMTLAAGEQRVELPVVGLPAGIYRVVVATGEERVTVPLTVE